jgi:hypothetical protein
LFIMNLSGVVRVAGGDRPPATLRPVGDDAAPERRTPGEFVRLRFAVNDR